MYALHRPNHRHIADLLRQDEEAREMLATTTNPDVAACCRADLETIRHSLWLAGWSPEPENT